MISFAHFFVPYVQFLEGAAYNIGQTLEGLGIKPHFVVQEEAKIAISQSSSPLMAVWLPFETTMLVLGILLLYSLLLIGLIVVAAYILGRRAGVFTALVLLALPGIAATLGLWPSIDYLPDTFVLGGTGTLGSVRGMFPLVFLGLLTGWSVVLILSDLLDFKDQFRHYYDHVWYLMAILTGIFFVADSNISGVVRELQRENQTARQASAYLLQQVRAYDLQCQKDPSIGTVSCAWASEVQQILSDYAAEGEIIFSVSGPKSSAEIYNPLGSKHPSQQIRTIRSELKAYNDSCCPVKVLGNGWSRMARPSATCQQPPSNFCTSLPDPFDGHIDTHITVAIASECIIPLLVRSRARQEKLRVAVADNARTKHFRWLFFVLFSLVVGGKVANTTSRAIELDKRPEQEKRRLAGLLQSLWLRAKNGVGLAIRGCRVVLDYVFSGLSWVACAFRKL